MTDVLVNGEIIELEEPETFAFSSVSVRKYKNIPKYLIIFASGISVTIHGYVDLLQITLVVPREFKGESLPPHVIYRLVSIYINSQRILHLIFFSFFFFVLIIK